MKIFNTYEIKDIYSNSVVLISPSSLLPLSRAPFTGFVEVDQQRETREQKHEVGPGRGGVVR